MPIPPEEMGITAGPFQLYPDIRLDATYNTNIFATRTGGVQDLIWTVTPSLIAKSEHDRGSVNFKLGASADRYQSYSRQNTNDYWLEGQGLYQLTDKTNIYGGVGYNRLHEDRGSPDLRFGIEPTTYTDTNAFIGAFHDAGTFYGRVGATFSRLSFNDVATSTPGVMLINKDRDRDLNAVGGRVGFRIDPTWDVFFQASTDSRDYQSTPDDSGYVRHSKGYRAAVGAAVNVSDRIVGEAYLGKMKQDYDDARLKDVSAPDYGASMRWHASPWTTYRFSIDRSLEETVIPGASSYVASSATAKVEHDLAEYTLLTAALTGGRNSFQGIERTDNYVEASVGIRHYLDKSIYVGAHYAALRRNSDALDANYSQNMVMFTVGSDFGARRRNRYFAYEPRFGLDFAKSRSGFGGFYLGGQLGFGNVGSTTSGLRDLTPGNTDRGDMSGTGSSGDLFAGIGTMLNQWYLGIEASAGSGNASLTHDHTSATEPLLYDLKQKDSYGLGARVGYVLESGPMLYAGAGAVRTTFANTMSNVDGSFANEFTKNGTRLAVGTDIPAGDNFFLRLEYAHTAYDDYHMVSTNYDEQYKNDESEFSIGAGWRFGREASSSRPVVDPEFMRGLYVGAGLGHSAFSSDVNVPRHFHAPATFDTLQADFGADGFSSAAFFGAGYTFKRWYLGAELEAEPSLASWQHDRVAGGGGGGRDFTMAKKSGYGLALRGGYILENGTLVYLRIGGVRTKFNTQYERGNSGLIDRDDTLSGTRVGLGAEMPISKISFWRADYTVTDYGDLPTFITPGASPDTVSFLNNKETLFRVSLGVRF